MNILFLDQFSEMGGAQHCLLDLLPAIREQGWRAQAALPGDGPFAKKLRAAGVDVAPIPCGPFRSGKKRAADLIRFARDLMPERRTIARLVDRGNCGLLYVNAPRLLPAAALASGGVPVVFHAHNPLAGASLRLARWSVGRANAAVIACSRHVGRAFPSGCTHVIPNGVADAGYREPPAPSGGAWRVGLIGRISPEKGHTEFLRAAALVARQIPYARFVICGESAQAPDSWVVELRALARDLPVEFLGWRDDAAAVLRSLDLLVIPSRSEGLPRVLLEAFSAGVPVVAFRAGGIAEAIQDGATGFLARESTADGLAARLLEVMLGAPDQLRDVAVNARRAWLQSYTLPAYRSGIIQVIQSAAASSCRVGPETAPPPIHR